ncbi:hypothetical protein EYF80_023525 [Liparis tanakae]|uniref:Uncharacterized protein n=1 Tax=Liparis tanakae TaxID=230148 RepID=A0A4Z2HL33_9TELE|nr:hypothetical protein EYF80_023525 [Liparis tanakae]
MPTNPTQLGLIRWASGRGKPRLQYKSFVGVPVSSWPQVAVAEIPDTSARLKYGGFKFKLLKPLEVPCPYAFLKSVPEKVQSSTSR